MTIFFAILFVLALGFAIFVLIKNKQLEGNVLRIQNEAQASVAEAQKLIDQQFAEMQQESERIRQHYEVESRKIQEAADALVGKTINDLEPLRYVVDRESP